MGAQRAFVLGIGFVVVASAGDAAAGPASTAPKTAVGGVAVAKPAPVPVVTRVETLDALGVKMVRPTKAGGRTWFAKWNAARALKAGQTDPKDSEFQNRGTGAFTVAGDGTATASGGVNRHYIWDQSAAKKWQNVEVTFYGNYKKLPPAPGPKPPPSGIMVEVRTGDGHNDDPAKQCSGASYALAFYDDGLAEMKKEAKHPVYSSRNPKANIWDGGPLPENKWIGFKAIVRDAPDGVEMSLYRDMTDGAKGGTWEKVLEYKDAGAWSVGDGSPICGKPATRMLTGAYPIVLIRNDNATTRYKKASVREIN